MTEAIPLDAPVDLGMLDAFLASDRAPPDCMQLAELDGFLAGIAAGPVPILPGVWLPHVWHSDEQPAFADMQEASAVLGNIVRRYNEIIRQADAGPGSYQPVFVQADDGTLDGSDWALGFIQAMSLCEDAWEPLATDPDGSILIAPIMLIASTTDKANLPLDADERLPDDEMAQLRADGGAIVSVCVSAIRQFFRRPQPKRRKAARRGPRRR